MCFILISACLVSKMNTKSLTRERIPRRKDEEVQKDAKFLPKFPFLRSTNRTMILQSQNPPFWTYISTLQISQIPISLTKSPIFPKCNPIQYSANSIVSSQFHSSTSFTRSTFIFRRKFFSSLLLISFYIFGVKISFVSLFVSISKKKIYSFSGGKDLHFFSLFSCTLKLFSIFFRIAC